MGKIIIPDSASLRPSNIVKYLKVGTSGCSIYIGEVKVSPSDEDIVNMKDKCLTLVAWENTTFIFTPSSSQTLSYVIGTGTTWATLPSTGVSVSGGQEVRFSGTCVPAASSSTCNGGVGTFSSTGKYHAEGNVMSLLGSGWSSNSSLQGKNWAFCNLFSGSTTLMSAEHLSLPATTLSTHCYRQMFYNCTNLTVAPELTEATTASNCYRSMFGYCSNLVKAPSSIKGINDTIAGSACTYMFNQCTSLKTAPSLPSLTIGNWGYRYMFSACTSLSIVQKELPATTIGDYCYSSMFQGCTSLVEAPDLAVMTVPSYGYYRMFYGCTKLTKAPELLATGFTSTYQYNGMFTNCTSLVKGPSVLPFQTIPTGAYRYMFSGCNKLTDSPIIKAESIPNSGCTNMFANCNKLTGITCLASSISTDSTGEATLNWVTNVAATGTFIKDASMTGWTSGNDGIPTGWTVKNSYGNVKYPLTFIARENCTFNFVGLSGNTLSCSTDEGVTWSAVPSTGVSVTAGNTVMWRGSCSGATAGSGATNSGIGHFEVTGSFDVEGNIMSLLFNDNFSGQTSLSNKGRVFSCLFSGCTGMTNAENLLLPATALTGYCYSQMFRGCTSLVTAPELPAMTIPLRAYAFMFVGCSSLIEAPELLATQLSSNSSTSAYTYMFSGCTSLIKPPSELPMTTIYQRCYSGMFCGCSALTYGPDILVPVIPTSGCAYMFSGCTSLKYVKCLATDISADNATTKWMTGVASQGTFIKDQTMTGWTRGAAGIPTNWKDSDYLTFVALERTRFRFNYPVSKESTNKLSYSINGGDWVDNLPNTIYTPYLEKGDKIRWKGNISAYVNGGSGTFESNGRFDAEGNVMSLMYGDNYETQTSLDSIIFQSLFENSKIVNANNLLLPSTTLAYYCYRYMFRGCTLLTTAPELPATTLTTACYYGMFSGCTSLNYIKAMFTTTPNTVDTRDWVKGVAVTGTFVKNSAATWDVTGVNGIPTGWTIQTASS